MDWTIALLLWEHVAERMAIMENRLVTGLLERHYHHRDIICIQNRLT